MLDSGLRIVQKILLDVLNLVVHFMHDHIQSACSMRKGEFYKEGTVERRLGK